MNRSDIRNFSFCDTSVIFCRKKTHKKSNVRFQHSQARAKYHFITNSRAHILPGLTSIDMLSLTKSSVVASLFAAQVLSSKLRCTDAD
jgi:hypothetical protein